MSTDDIVVVERNFGLTLGDFSRIFPRIWPEFKQLSEFSAQVVFTPTGSLEVTLSAQQYRRLASLRIPYLDISFRFFNTSEEQRAEFFEEFERSFQKGGG
jgi:hypothetical protein